MSDRQVDSAAGVAAGTASYVVWGLFPIYFKALVGVPPTEVLAYRVLCSLALIAAVVAARGRLSQLRAISAGTWLMLTASALCIGTNWILYVFATMGVHVLDASLGYFVSPLISILLGTMLLGERLDGVQWVSVAVAAAGVLLMAFERGSVPLASLGIALSFALYGLIRNRAPVDASSGLLIETTMLAPPAALFLVLHGGSAGYGTTKDLLLAGTAIATAVPLLLFGWAARRVTLSTLGVLQYVSPTIVFLLAVFAYREPLPRGQLAAFAVIWLALIVYIADGWWRGRRSRTAAGAKPTA